MRSERSLKIRLKRRHGELYMEACDALSSSDFFLGALIVRYIQLFFFFIIANLVTTLMRSVETVFDVL